MRKSTLKIVYEILNVEEKDKLANRNMIKRNTERKNKVGGGKREIKKNIRQKIRTQKEKKSRLREEKKKKKMDNLSKEE